MTRKPRPQRLGQQGFQVTLIVASSRSSLLTPATFGPSSIISAQVLHELRASPSAYSAQL